jgi:predicted membrane metal-binding protein
MLTSEKIHATLVSVWGYPACGFLLILVLALLAGAVLYLLGDSLPNSFWALISILVVIPIFFFSVGYHSFNKKEEIIKRSEFDVFMKESIARITALDARTRMLLEKMYLKDRNHRILTDKEDSQ